VGLAKIGDGVEEILSADTRLDVAAGCRGLEQCCEGRPELLKEVARQAVECRVARMQGGGEPALGGKQLGAAQQPLSQRLS